MDGMRTGRLAAAIALAASLAPRAGRADPAAAILAPVPWREPSPLMRLFLQLPFDAPATVARGAVRGELDVLYSNSLLAARNDALAVDVHVESMQVTPMLRAGVADGVELELAAPVLLDTGGFLDRPIETVEGWLAASSPQRAGRPRNAAVFSLVRRDGTGIERRGAEAGIGDAWAGAKIELARERGARPAISARAAVKVPTGSAPFGSGTVDLGAGLLAGWTFDRLALRLALDASAPTGELRVARIRTRPYGAAQAGLAWQASPRVAVHAQLAGHASPLGGTGLGVVDAPTFYVLAGAGVALPARLELRAAVVENVFSPYRGADVTFVLGLARR